MTDRNTISQVIESLFEDWIDRNINVHPLAVENMRTLEADALALLKEQEAVEPNEWIKRSDEMPEEQESIFAKYKGTDKWSPAMFAKSSEDVRVVVVFDDGTRRVSHSHTIDGKWECENRPLKRTVTHWMPNPKLPQEGR